MPILYEKQGHVAIITLSRPERRNAWCPEFYGELKARFDEVDADRDVRCAILTGDEAGGAFSAGADLSDDRTHNLPSAAEFVENLPKARYFPSALPGECSKPVVAAVNGYAIGIGCGLTCGCDLIVASERAEWRYPQVRLGLLPAYGGTVRMARWVGKGAAMKLAMGFPMKAEEAYRVGLAQWLVPHEQLMEKALEVATQIAGYPPLATRLVKESISHGMDIPLSEASLVDVYRFMALERSDDFREAHSAWRERRQPVFRGE
jgi:enoyl-CoA hydratase/carnithine racemase